MPYSYEWISKKKNNFFYDISKIRRVLIFQHTVQYTVQYTQFTENGWCLRFCKYKTPATCSSSRLSIKWHSFVEKYLLCKYHICTLICYQTTYLCHADTFLHQFCLKCLSWITKVPVTKQFFLNCQHWLTWDLSPLSAAFYTVHSSTYYTLRIASGPASLWPDQCYCSSQEERSHVIALSAEVRLSCQIGILWYYVANWKGEKIIWHIPCIRHYRPTYVTYYFLLQICISIFAKGKSRQKLLGVCFENSLGRSGLRPPELVISRNMD